MEEKRKYIKYFNQAIDTLKFNNYQQARIYACLKNKPEVYKFLHAMEANNEEAISFIQAQHDPLFQDLWNDREFKDIINRQNAKWATIRKDVEVALAEQHLGGEYRNE